MAIEWVGFLLAVAILLVVSLKDLSLALLLGSIVLGLATIGATATIESFMRTVTSADVVLLALAMGLFPILGSLLQETGALDDLIENLRVGRRFFLSFSAALIGLLPVPGGALLSAPLVDGDASTLSPERRFAINIWFRHVLIFIYPIGPTLLVPAKIANVPVYEVIPYLIPFFLLLVALGYIFLLRDIEDDVTYHHEADTRKLVKPLLLILIPPVIHLSFTTATSIEPTEIIIFFAVLASVVLAVVWGNIGPRRVARVTRVSKPWKFFFTIIGIYLFINVFTEAGMDARISGLDVSLIVMCMGIAFFLALVTGRTQVAASVVFPTYLSSAGLFVMPYSIFSITYLSIFLGHLLSPVHPCIPLSLEYFKTSIGAAFRTMGVPTAIMLGVAVVLFMVFT
jgi:integral membrane protein (TIGR00529 family)